MEGVGIGSLEEGGESLKLKAVGLGQVECYCCQRLNG
jgi:hypothetical protein